MNARQITGRSNYAMALVAALSLLLCATKAGAQDTPCAFNKPTLSYLGSPQEQAKCLLRPVKIFGHIGPTLSTLPAPLDSIVGQTVTVDGAKLSSFLTAHSIKEADIGGALSSPVSPANIDNPRDGRAKYFIIHDTSSPNFLGDPFPANINDATAPHNKLDKYRRVEAEKVAHVFINRVGESATAVDFKNLLGDRKFGTKFARVVLGARRKGLLLHVELIQPRRRSPSGGRLNDAIAPDPGFTEAQLDRLALVYVAASVRRGEWMIPAFHSVMDVTIPDAHDDPQHFDLNLWAERLKMLIDQIRQ